MNITYSTTPYVVFYLIVASFVGFGIATLGVVQDNRLLLLV